MAAFATRPTCASRHPAQGRRASRRRWRTSSRRREPTRSTASSRKAPSSTSILSDDAAHLRQRAAGLLQPAHQGRTLRCRSRIESHCRSFSHGRGRPRDDPLGSPIRGVAFGKARASWVPAHRHPAPGQGGGLAHKRASDREEEPPRSCGAIRRSTCATHGSPSISAERRRWWPSATERTASSSASGKAPRPPPGRPRPSVVAFEHLPNTLKGWSDRIILPLTRWGDVYVGFGARDWRKQPGREGALRTKACVMERAAVARSSGDPSRSGRNALDSSLTLEHPAPAGRRGRRHQSR